MPKHAAGNGEGGRRDDFEDDPGGGQMSAHLVRQRDGEIGHVAAAFGRVEVNEDVLDGHDGSPSV